MHCSLNYLKILLNNLYSASVVVAGKRSELNLLILFKIEFTAGFEAGFKTGFKAEFKVEFKNKFKAEFKDDF